MSLLLKGSEIEFDCLILSNAPACRFAIAVSMSYLPKDGSLVSSSRSLIRSMV